MLCCIELAVFVSLLIVSNYESIICIACRARAASYAGGAGSLARHRAALLGSLLGGAVTGERFRIQF